MCMGVSCRKPPPASAGGVRGATKASALAKACAHAAAEGVNPLASASSSHCHWPPLAATKRRGGARALQRCAGGLWSCCAKSYLQRGAYGRGAHDRLRDVGRVVQAQMSSGRGGVKAIPHASGTPPPLQRRLVPILAETAVRRRAVPPFAPAFKIPPPTARQTTRNPRLGPQPLPQARHTSRQPTSVASQTRPAHDESPGTTIL